jgi:hypothetical protein
MLWDFCAVGSKIGGTAPCCWATISSGASSGTWTVVGCVDRTLALYWSNWPLCIATDCGGWQCIYVKVRPGHVVKHISSMALYHMERIDDKSDA